MMSATHVCKSHVSLLLIDCVPFALDCVPFARVQEVCAVKSIAHKLFTNGGDGSTQPDTWRDTWSDLHCSQPRRRCLKHGGGGSTELVVGHMVGPTLFTTTSSLCKTRWWWIHRVCGRTHGQTHCSQPHRRCVKHGGGGSTELVVGHMVGPTLFTTTSSLCKTRWWWIHRACGWTHGQTHCSQPHRRC
jgi:hypothetical protein